MAAAIAPQRVVWLLSADLTAESPSVAESAALPLVVPDLSPVLSLADLSVAALSLADLSLLSAGLAAVSATVAGELAVKSTIGAVPAAVFAAPP